MFLKIVMFQRMLVLPKDDKSSATVANPCSSGFEATRTASLISGLLKTVLENNHYPKPIKIFEMGGDVVLLDNTEDVDAKNSRNLQLRLRGD
ncbi:hypothetical protein MKW98_019424 [Papaver atlanticum]|uniref:Phenylalanyl tRNA synthetase beta chain core domain-containing protein n=1 Tax=Papaver atlanticum TaxID=357466 RepID=A0AAD4XA05_9MAGN|nr:hypothetical protein MKW98_019424 [Papaver atlanticum]